MRAIPAATCCSRPSTIPSPPRPVNGALTRTPFPGNIIPTSQQNPVAVKVFSYIPAGNVAGDPVTGLNNLTNNGSTRKFTDFFPENTGRVRLQHFRADPFLRALFAQCPAGRAELPLLHEFGHQRRRYRTEQSVHARESQRHHPVHAHAQRHDRARSPRRPRAFQIGERRPAGRRRRTLHARLRPAVRRAGRQLVPEVHLGQL